MLATSLPVAQGLKRPTGVRKVMGAIPVGDSDFFFVVRSRHAEYSIFSYYWKCLYSAISSSQPETFKAHSDVTISFIASSCLCAPRVTVVAGNVRPDS